MLETSSNLKLSLCNLAAPKYQVLANLNSFLKPQFKLLNIPRRQSCAILLRISCINQCAQSSPKLWCRSSSISREFSSSSGDCKCSICCRDNAVNLPIDSIMVFVNSDLDQVWSISPALKLLLLSVTSRGGAFSMQAKWIKLDVKVTELNNTG